MCVSVGEQTDDEGAYDRVGEEHDPLESVPSSAGTGAPALLPAEPSSVDTVVVVIAAAWHTCLVAPERLSAASELRDEQIGGILPSPALAGVAG